MKATSRNLWSVRMQHLVYEMIKRLLGWTILGGLTVIPLCLLAHAVGLVPLLVVLGVIVIFVYLLILGIWLVD